MPGALKRRLEAMRNGDIPKESTGLEESRKNGFHGFLKSTLYMVKNKYLMIVLIGMSAELFIVTGLTPFYTKFLGAKFGADPPTAAIMLGTIIIIGAVGEGHLHQALRKSTE